MAVLNGNNIFFGEVITVEGSVDKLPSWFPDVNPVNDLSTHFGSDMSEYYADVCLYYPSLIYKYAYVRCYSNIENNIEFYMSNMNPPFQIRMIQIANGSKVAYRAVLYKDDGTVYTYDGRTWSDSGYNILGNDGKWDTSKAYIVYKGSGFRTQAPYGYRFYVI